MITLSKRKRDNKNKVIAVWSPTATGKTLVAVNFSVLLSHRAPTALVDLSADNAVYTWLNCPGTNSLEELAEGNVSSYFAPLNAPKLQVYTSDPGSKNIYNGEASVLSTITKALDGFYVVYDTPRDFLKAANILSLADTVLLVADYNIHGTLLLQKFLKQIKNKTLVINRYSDSYPELTNPGEMLGIQPTVVIPDSPAKAYQSVLTGVPLVNDTEFQELFETLLKGVGNIAE